MDWADDVQVFSVGGKQGCSEQSGDFFRALSASIGQTSKSKLHGAGTRPKLGTSAAHPYGISTAEQQWIKQNIYKSLSAV